MLWDLPIQGGSCGPGESPIDVGAASAVCMTPDMAAAWGTQLGVNIGQGGQRYNPYAPTPPSYPLSTIGQGGGGGGGFLQQLGMDSTTLIILVAVAFLFFSRR